MMGGDLGERIIRAAGPEGRRGLLGLGLAWIRAAVSGLEALPECPHCRSREFLLEELSTAHRLVVEVEAEQRRTSDGESARA